MILTIDLGTTVTKAVLWGKDRPLGIGRAVVPTHHPQAGWVEQHPSDWWDALEEAVGQAGAGGADVSAIAFSSARETFVPVRADGASLGPALVWSDQRAVAEAGELGVDVAASAAKALWLQRHDSVRFSEAHWLLSPRDWIILRLAGVALTDRTMASRTGWYAASGELRDGSPDHLLPPVVTSATIVGELSADGLGLPAGIPIVIGAGDRACEVLGAGAAAERPMVSWGTTANLSVPVQLAPAAPSGPPWPPGAATISAGALDGSLLECGLSAAGAALEWLARVSGHSVDAMASLAAGVPPGSGGVLAMPWFNGARAPWWQPGGRAAFVGLTPSVGVPELARAIYEGVAFDVHRCAELVCVTTGTPLTALCGAGGGAATDLWPVILASVVQRPVERRTHAALAASVGARLLAAAALGETLSLDEINPIAGVVDPDPGWTASYRGLRASADRAAGAVLGI